MKKILKKFCTFKKVMYICKVINNEKTRIMKTMSTIEELDIKMIKIAESVGMSIEKFKSLPRLKFMKICNEYNSKNK